MKGGRLRAAIRYALMLMPTALLVALVGIVAIGGWVTAVLREPARFASAPVLIQKLTRAAYWHTRKHWHTVPECVVYDAELLYRPRPGECTFENAEFHTRMRFDERGARRTLAPITVEAAPAPRVLIVGDSHAMGWGVEDQETFASVLAVEYEFRTINLAVSSYGTARELKRLEQDIDLDPADVVIIQYCDNDYEENRHFARHARVGPYDRAELDRLIAYQPTAVQPLPIAGLLLRLAVDDLLEKLPWHRRNRDAEPVSPSAAFLAVLAAHPDLGRQRLLVLAINGPDVVTHLSTAELAAAGFELIVPDLAQDDFFAMDDHMRARGHTAVAAQLASRLRDLLPAQPH